MTGQRLVRVACYSWRVHCCQSGAYPRRSGRKEFHDISGPDITPCPASRAIKPAVAIPRVSPVSSLGHYPSCWLDTLLGDGSRANSASRRSSFSYARQVTPANINQIPRAETAEHQTHNMRAARYYGTKDVRVEDVEPPTPSENQVLVETAWCGLCGSDLKNYISGEFKVWQSNNVRSDFVSSWLVRHSNK